MKKGLLALLLLLFLYGCEKTEASSVDTTAKVMEHLIFSAVDYELNSDTDSFIKIGVENRLEQPLRDASFYLSLHEEDEANKITPNPFYLLPQEKRIDVPAGETIEISFNIPPGYLAESYLKDLERLGRLIVFIEADGYLKDVEKESYYYFSNGLEYSIY